MSKILRRVGGSVVSLLARRQGVRRVVNGSIFRVDPRTRHVFATEYDPEVAEFLRDEIRPGDEIWNVGANVGVYVRQLMRWLDSTGRIVAFEPNPVSAELLRANVRLAEDDVNVEVIESAVGESVGTVTFFTAGSDGMARGGVPNPELPETSEIEVPVTTLDHFAVERGHKPALIVMDIEGWEIAALKGARSVLGQSQAVVEMHPSAWEWSGHSRSDLEALLEEEGLEVIGLEGQADPLSEHGRVVLRPMTNGNGSNGNNG